MRLSVLSGLSNGAQIKKTGYGPRDHDFLVGGNYPHLHPPGIRRNDRRIPGVAPMIQFDTKKA
jgi:hypothetical protein